MSDVIITVSLDLEFPDFSGLHAFPCKHFLQVHYLSRIGPVSFKSLTLNDFAIFLREIGIVTVR